MLHDKRVDVEATRWCPQTIAKLVHITPITMVFVGDISIVFMGL